MSINDLSAHQSIQHEHLLQAVINAVPAPIFYKDAEGRYLGCNQAFEAFIGFNKAELIGKTVFELFEPELADVYDSADKKLFDKKGSQIYEAQVRYADGTLHDVIFHKAVFNAVFEEIESIEGIVGVILDVTDRKQAQQELEKLAITDSLTGLVNRYFIVKELEHTLLRAARHSSKVAFLMLDLDNFKAVNDTHGHPTGDKLIISVAKRIQSVVRKSDIVARLGGDEFAILLEGEDIFEIATNVASKVLDLLHTPFIIDGHEINIGVSIGIAVNLSADISASEIMKKADIAMYFVKEQGKGDYKFCHQLLDC